VLWYRRHVRVRLSRFFFDMVGLTISAVKSEAMMFSTKHYKPDVTLWIDGRRLPQTKEFKYLGVFFDSEGYAEIYKYGTYKNDACKD
jgi:hypothetical protein